MTTSAQAIDECADLFHAMAATLFPDAEIRWAGVEKKSPPGALQSWFRWTMQHTEGGQASLSCEHGERRWRRNGLIIVQCFGSLEKGSLTLAQRMAESVRDAYQGTATPSGVWFRSATTQEIGHDTSWYQVNAIIQFTYDDVR